MSKEKKHALSEAEGLIPELRFPEFVTDGEWVVKKLGDEEVASLVNDKISSNKLRLDTYISTENILPDYSGISIATKLPSTGKVTRFVEGDILISNIRPYLKKVWKSDRQGGASNDVLVFRSGSEVINEFLEFILKNDAFINYVMQSAKGVKMPRGDKDSIIEYNIRIPSKKEQQKIASCLSSLDELIAAHNDKLQALKDHKKGLMQNLFPQKGEKVPKYRFPEFEKDGKWEEKPLEDVCNLVRGPFGGALKKEIFVKEGFAVYEQSHAIYGDFNSFRYYINDEKYKELKRFAVKPGDLIMSCSGTMGKFAIIPKDYKQGVINQALLKLTVKKDYNNLFIKMSLETDNNQNMLLSQSAGGAIKNVVSVKQIKELKFLIPSMNEQQKIASCLSALDELITAEAEKIEQLQLHKKGLMQGLFPNIVNV